MLCKTSVLPKPVTVAFETDAFMLTGPSPWNILIRLNFIGSMVSIASKPLIPREKKVYYFLTIHSDWMECNFSYQQLIVWITLEYFLSNNLQNLDHQFDMILSNHLQAKKKIKTIVTFFKFIATYSIGMNFWVFGKKIRLQYDWKMHCSHSDCYL